MPKHAEGYQRSWAGLLAAAVTYAVALFISYLATFVLFLSTPFRPNGPFRGRTCQQPHLVFGQICRDWTEPGMSAAAHVAWGAVFLAGFLLLALLTRRFAWVLLLVPIATLPYINSERSIWVVLTVVSVVSAAFIAALRLIANPQEVTPVAYFSLGLLSVGTASAAALSILYSGPPIPSLRDQAGLTIVPSTSIADIACPSPATCIAIGYGGSKAVELHIGGDGSMQPSPMGGGEPSGSIACASTADCIAADVDTAPMVEHDGVWQADRSLNPRSFLFTSRDACSPHGTCWTTFQREFAAGPDVWYENAYVVGERNGRWLPVQSVGPPLTHGEKKDGARVFVSGITCWSPSSCTLSGSTLPSEKPPFAGFQPFVQSETDGVWGKPMAIPSGLGTNPKDHFQTFPLFSPISCTASGTCLLGGYEARGTSIIGAAVEQEIRDRWQPTVIGDGTSFGGEYSQVAKVACHATSICIAAGGGNTRGKGWLFFRASTRGSWHKALVVPTPDEFSLIGPEHPTAAACPTSTTCYVVGWSTTPRGFFNRLGFLASYVRGRWSFKTFALGHGESSTALSALGCTTTKCWAVGTAQWGTDQVGGFVFPVAHLTLVP